MQARRGIPNGIFVVHGDSYGGIYFAKRDNCHCRCPFSKNFVYYITPLHPCQQDLTFCLKIIFIFEQDYRGIIQAPPKPYQLRRIIMSYISELRKLVGHAPIMAVAAMGILWTKETGILLEKRTDTGEWCTPGGAIELGESLETALRREIKEETNLYISSFSLFDIHANTHMVYPNGDEVYYTDVVYEVNGFSGELKPDGESKELRFFPLEELPDNIMPTQSDYIKRFAESKGYR